MNAPPISSGAASFSPMGSRVNSHEFLTLLTTQLRYQDPFQPTSNTEFMSQLAQLTQLEETQSQSRLLESIALTSIAGASLQGLAQAASLIGKNVSYMNGSFEMEGTVTGVRFDGGGIQLDIGEKNISLGDVLSVSAQP